MTPMIAMPGPWLPEAAPGREPDAETLPPLPALDRLLQRGRKLPDAAGWRAGVMYALGLPADLAPVIIASRATALHAGEAVCFATPLHLVAGLSRVHLAPGGPLRFDAAEEQAWLEAFNSEFGVACVVLHAAGAGGAWLLAAPFAAAARDNTPEGLAGAPLTRRAAEGPEEKALRRLAAECEMWLAAHALNRQREARGLPAFNALWFWGGARMQLPPLLRRPLHLASGGAPDAWLAGLAAHAAQPVHRTDGFDAAMQVITGGAAADVLFVPAMPADAPPHQHWLAIEEQWIAPALAACDAGRIEGLRVQIGGGTWQWPARGLGRWMRRDRRSWWQIAGVPR